MAIERIDEDLCNGCMICVDSCPMDVIRMEEDKNRAVIKYRIDCITCFSCEMDCPTNAIYVGPERAIQPPSPWIIPE